MDRAKSTVFPILLIVVFGLAFAAGVRSLTSNKGSDRAQGSSVLDMAESTDDAFALAKAEGKVVMVKYGAEWCGPCRAMKQEAFQDASVAEALKGVVVVDVDVDDPGADSEWLKSQEIGPIPTVQFFRADGSKIGEFVGYQDVERFIEDVKKILAKA
jgi:thiol:disulfide interchange protein